jgi:hypothetical protein
MSITISEIANTDTKLSGNEIRVVATTSGAPAGATEYKILLKIESPDGLLFGAPFIDAIAPNAAGVAVFDISGYVDQHHDFDIKWPIPNEYEGRWHGYPSQAYDVRLSAGERYIDEDDELQESFQSVWGTVFVIKGKLDNLQLARLNDIGATWFSHYCEGGRWFSYLPLVQTIAPNQPVKLWWKPPTTSFSFTLKGKAYYSDGSTRNYSGSGMMWYNVIFEFSVQPRGLEFYPVIGEAKLLYYEMWMEGSPGVEKRTFIVDQAYHENNNFLFIDNGMGGAETIWLSGAIKFNPSGDQTIASKNFISGSGTKKRTRFLSSSNRTRKWTINSGFKSKAEMAALDMLLDTRNAWLALQPESGSTLIEDYSLIPVIITSSELGLTDSMNDLQSVDIEIEEAY